MADDRDEELGTDTDDQDAELAAGGTEELDEDLDEGSEDEDLEGEDSEDEDLDDEDSDDEASEASSSRRPGRKPKTGKRRSRKGRPSGGTRLAAAKAAKAAAKAAQRAQEKKEREEEEAGELPPEEQPDVEEEVLQKAQVAGQWAQDNQPLLYTIIAILVIGIGGAVLWQSNADSESAAATALLNTASETLAAPIRAADAPAPAEGDEEELSFADVQARAEAALTNFQAVSGQYPGSDAAHWARLGEARSLFILGRFDEARAAYDLALSEGGGDSMIGWQALEGRGFTHEAEEAWSEARATYTELGALSDGRYEHVANYHVGRMQLAEGDRDAATQTFTELVTALREAESEENAQSFEFILAQAEVRLRELDPSAAPAPRFNGLSGGAGAPGLPGGGGAAGGSPGGGLSQEQIQEMIRRFQQQQGNAPAGEAPSLPLPTLPTPTAPGE